MNWLTVRIISDYLYTSTYLSFRLVNKSNAKMTKRSCKQLWLHKLQENVRCISFIQKKQELTRICMPPYRLFRRINNIPYIIYDAKYIAPQIMDSYRRGPQDLYKIMKMPMD